MTDQIQFPPSSPPEAAHFVQMGPAASAPSTSVTTITTSPPVASSPFVIPPELVNLLAQHAQQAAATVLPQLEAAAKDLVAVEVARFKASPQLQDYAIIAGIAVVFVIALAIFGTALLGNLYAQSLVTKAAMAVGMALALLVKAFTR